MSTWTRLGSHPGMTDIILVDVYYPDYTPVWDEGRCINTHSLPAGRPTYSTLVACCKAIYSLQPSGERPLLPLTLSIMSNCELIPNIVWNNYILLIAGKCLSGLTSPPSMGRTDTVTADVTTSLTEIPNPPTMSSTDTSGDAPTFLSELPNPVTMSPAYNSGDDPTLTEPPNHLATSPSDIRLLDVYYADFAPIWNEGRCINARPLPVGRLTYSTLIACCKAVYSNQVPGE